MSPRDRETSGRIKPVWRLSGRLAISNEKGDKGDKATHAALGETDKTEEAGNEGPPSLMPGQSPSPRAQEMQPVESCLWRLVHEQPCRERAIFLAMGVFKAASEGNGICRVGRRCGQGASFFCIGCV